MPGYSQDANDCSAGGYAPLVHATLFFLAIRTTQSRIQRYIYLPEYHMLKFRILTIPVLAGCASQTERTTSLSYQSMAQKYEAASTQSLWLTHQTTSSGLELAFVEAELASRGQTQSGNAYLGQRTSGAYGRSTFSRAGSSASDAADCGDFSSPAEAQKYFLASGGPHSDPNDLDRDGDGLACEWGVSVRQIATSYRAALQARSTVRRRSYSGRKCYTGPRGGTYTITASGNKNYDGC